MSSKVHIYRKQTTKPVLKKSFLNSCSDYAGSNILLPRAIFIFYLWDNQLIVWNNRPLRKLDYPLLSNIDTIADFYHPISGILKTRDELEDSMKCVIDNDTYIGFLYIINCAKRKIGIEASTSLATQLPFQPLLVQILTFVRKGCSFYYRMLRKKWSLETSLSSREEKWHEELGMVLTPQFWNNTYSRTAEIKNDNRLKWLQFQIHRNILYTNYRVNKYDRQVSPYCTFCLQEDASTTNLEGISHLFK